MGELIVAVNIGRKLLDGIRQSQYRRIFACLCVQHTYTIVILDGEVDVLEYLFALSSCAKSIDGNSHANENCNENDDSVNYHCFE